MGRHALDGTALEIRVPASPSDRSRVGETEDPSLVTAPTDGVMPPGKEPLVLRWLLERGSRCVVVGKTVRIGRDDCAACASYLAPGVVRWESAAGERSSAGRTP